MCTHTQVVTREIDAAFYEQSGADISLVPVAEVMRVRSEAIGLIESPADDWDAPVRVHTESLGDALGMDWPKYEAAMASDAPTATERRLRLKLSRLDIANTLGQLGDDAPASDASSSPPPSSRAPSSRRESLPTTRSSTTCSSGQPSARHKRAGSTHSGERGTKGGGAASARGSSASAPRRKVVYTRDGRAIDSTMRSSNETRLLERVQGHSSLTAPTTAHASISKYVGDDGTSLVTEGATTIQPKQPAHPSALLPKWQLQKQQDELQKQVRALCSVSVCVCGRRCCLRLLAVRTKCAAPRVCHVFHVLPLALHAWLTPKHFRAAHFSSSLASLTAAACAAAAACVGGVGVWVGSQGSHALSPHTRLTRFFACVCRAARQLHRKTHIDYSLLAPKLPTWVPEWQRVRGERIEGGADGLLNAAASAAGLSSASVKPTGAASSRSTAASRTPASTARAA
jgi:hypothetical protein